MTCGLFIPYGAGLLRTWCGAYRHMMRSASVHDAKPVGTWCEAYPCMVKVVLIKLKGKNKGLRKFGTLYS